MKQRLFAGLAIIFIITFLPSIAFCNVIPKYWEFGKSIKILDGSRKTAAFPIDQQVYGSAKTYLSDVRIVDQNNIEVPCAIFTQPEMKKESKLSSNIFSKETTQTECVLIAEIVGQETIFNSITIIPERKNFIRKITIEGSNDGKGWEVIRKDIAIYAFAFQAQGAYLENYTNEIYSSYLFESYSSEESLSVKFPEADYKFLRVVIPHGKDKEPVEIKNVEIFKTIIIEPEENTFQGSIIKSESDIKTKSIDNVVDFSMKNLPLSRIIISTNESNFFRRIEIYSSNDLQKWERVGEGTIFSIAVDENIENNLTLNFNETRCRCIKLKVFNGDNKPIKITSVIGHGLKQFAVFIPEEGLQYKLIYGNAAAKWPNYDVGQLLKQKLVSNFGKSVTGDEIRNANFEVYKEAKPWTEDKPYLLWIAMLLIGLGLIFFGFQVVKKTG